MKVKNGYILRNIADEWIIVPIGARVHDFNGLMTVNETGAFLWELLKEDKSEEELVNELLNEYDVEEEIAKFDVNEFIKLLINNDVIDIL